MVKVIKTQNIALSPNGKAQDFDSCKTVIDSSMLVQIQQGQLQKCRKIK